MRIKVVTTSIAFGLAFAIAGPVKASTITFETLPDGLTTPTDNAALTALTQSMAQLLTLALTSMGI